MFCRTCPAWIPASMGRCPRCYPEWHAYGSEPLQVTQMSRGRYPQPIQQPQLVAPRPAVRYEPMPQPRVTVFGSQSGYAHQNGPAAQGPPQQQYTPNFERQYNPVNSIATPRRSTLQAERVPNRAVAFEIDDQAEHLLANREELLQPRALKEKWKSISDHQHRQQSILLNQNQRFLAEYMTKMDVAGYMNLDHWQFVSDTIQMIVSWRIVLNSIHSRYPDHETNEVTISGKRYVNKKHSFVARGAPGQPLFETGIIDQDWELRDIRRKRFINCGAQCAHCAGGEADHPERTHNEMYEIFSYFVGPKLTDKRKWCQICMKQRFTKKARLHQTDQHDLGMWYDHPDNDVDQLGQYEGWRHDFPSKDLKWKPKPVAQMYADMRRARMPANAYT